MNPKLHSKSSSGSSPLRGTKIQKKQNETLVSLRVISITIDNKTFSFSDDKQEYIAWAPIPANRQIPDKAFFQLFIKGSGEISVPLSTDRKRIKLFAQGKTPGSIGEEVPFNFENGFLKIKISEESSNRWLYLTGSLL